MICVYANNAFTQSDIDMGSLEQIVSNWNKQPFTSVSVTNYQCQPGQEPLFTYSWGGTERGCVTTSGFSRIVKTWSSTSDEYCDQDIWRVRGFQTTLINGLNICGVRGGLPWKDVKRPDYSTKKCPNGTLPCSNQTSEQNTVCYPPAQHDQCPITDLKFVYS